MSELIPTQTMEQYLKKKKELDSIATLKADEFATELIFKSKGQTVLYLRNLTLEFIRNYGIPEDISTKLKKKIDEYISNLKIPAQND